MEDVHVEAKYADGFILSEENNGDLGQFVEGNTLSDILSKIPEQYHGRMVEFRCHIQQPDGILHLSYDWTLLPDNARPVRYVTRAVDANGPMQGVIRRTKVGFGAQWVDDQGKSHKDIQEF